MTLFAGCTSVDDSGSGHQSTTAGVRAVESVAHLEDMLSRPSPEDIACLRKIDGDVAVLGAGGKMGPSLVRRLRRASDATGGSQRVFAASISWDPGVRESLAFDGIET